jgi:hypothetical protein
MQKYSGRSCYPNKSVFENWNAQTHDQSKQAPVFQ